MKITDLLESGIVDAPVAVVVAPGVPAAMSDSHFAKAHELFDSLVTIPLESNPA
jgi:hypothetical protein